MIEKNDLEDQFRDRRFILAMILLCISVGCLIMLFFWEIPESNQITFGVISGIIFGWTGDALKDYFNHIKNNDNSR